MCERDCKCCDKFLKTTSVSVTGAAPNQTVTYVINTQTLVNNREYCLVFCQALPVGSDTLPVVIVNGATILPVLVRNGNRLRADQLKTRCKYNVVFGNDTGHLLIENCVRRTGFKPV